MSDGPGQRGYVCVRVSLQVYYSPPVTPTSPYPRGHRATTRRTTHRDRNHLDVHPPIPRLAPACVLPWAAPPLHAPLPCTIPRIDTRSSAGMRNIDTRSSAGTRKYPTTVSYSP
eukprot:217845-Prymnesium_polylepis.1